MTKDLGNIEDTKRALNDIRFQIKSLRRIQKQLKLHYAKILKSKR